MEAEKVKEKLLKKSPVKKLTNKDFVSTGSTLLNLACTGKPFYGFAKGSYYTFVGGTSSGKTWLCLTCFAEAAMNPNFDEYRLIYDNSENGAFMEIEKFFGSKVAQRLESPGYDKKEKTPVFSSTIEEFYYHVDDAIKAKKPFIYVLDSMDSLTSEDEVNKFEENKKAYLKGREGKGSYGDGKAKKNSGNLRQIVSKIKKTDSILIIISQTRDVLNAMPFGPKKCRSGGNALDFYASLIMWSSVREKIKKEVKGKKRQLGIKSQVQVTKNRFTGKERIVTIPIYHSFGIDDIGSCVDYLIEEGHWKKKGSIIEASEFGLSLGRDKLIQKIEKRGLEKDLRALVGEVWNEIEEECKIERKKRYE